MVEDFESFTAGDDLTTGSWTLGSGTYTAETVAGTVAATAGGAGDATNLDISANQIAAGDTGTVFFQFRIDSSVPMDNGNVRNMTLDFNAGVAPGAVGGSSGDQGAYINLGAPDQNNRTLQGRDGGNSQLNLQTGLNADSWYNLWLVLDNGATTASGSETYDIHLSEGRTNSATPTLVADDFAFRDSPSGDPVDTIFLNKFRDAGGAYFDNFYVDSSAENLVNPVPEPTTYAALLGMAALGFVLLRRRR